MIAEVDTAGQAKEMARLCGELTTSNGTKTFTIQSGKAKITFRSDGSVRKMGYKLKYTFLP